MTKVSARDDEETQISKQNLKSKKTVSSSYVAFVEDRCSLCVHRSSSSVVLNFIPAAFICCLGVLFILLTIVIMIFSALIGFILSLNVLKGTIENAVKNINELQQGNEVIPKSFRAFFLGSNLVDSTEFAKFVADSEVFHALPTRYSWLGLIPQPQTNTFFSSLKSTYLLDSNETNFYTLSPDSQRIVYTESKPYYFPLAYTAPLAGDFVCIFFL